MLGRYVAFKGGNLFKDYVLIGFGGLVHIEECNNLLTIHVVVHTFAILIDSAVILIFTVKYGKIVIYGAIVTSFT